MATTAAQLIDQAARKALIGAEEQQLDPYVFERGLEILNSIIDEWGGSGVTIPYQSVLNFSTIGGQESYTNGIGSYDINTNQIIGIVSGYLTYNTIRYPLIEMTEKMYKNIFNPVTQAIPRLLLIRKDNDLEVSTLFFQPVPATIYAVTLLAKQRLSNVSLTDDLSTIPRHWYLALQFLVAYHYQIVFKLPISPAFKLKYDELQKQYKAQNTIDVSVEKTELIQQPSYYYPLFYGIAP